jgi:hypothetical protein
VRLPRRGCSPAPLKFPSRRFGSCSLNGAPFEGLPARLFDARPLALFFVLAFSDFGLPDFFAMIFISLYGKWPRQDFGRMFCASLLATIPLALQDPILSLKLVHHRRPRCQTVELLKCCPDSRRHAATPRSLAAATAQMVNH